MKALQRKSTLLAATIALLGAGAALQNLAVADVAARDVAATDPAVAQIEPLPEVLIEAGPINRTIVGRAPLTGAPIESVTVAHRVHYSDLDLASHADVLTLQQRIETAARDACGQLDELFPIHSSEHQTRTCIADAVSGASQQMQQAITDAQEDARS